MSQPCNYMNDTINVSTAISNVRGSGTVKIENSVTGDLILRGTCGINNDRLINFKAPEIKGKLSAGYNRGLKIEGGTVIRAEETGYNPNRRGGTIATSGLTGDLKLNGDTITLQNDRYSKY